MGVIIAGDFKVVHVKRDFALNVFVLTRFIITKYMWQMWEERGKVSYNLVHK